MWKKIHKKSVRRMQTKRKIIYERINKYKNINTNICLKKTNKQTKKKNAKKLISKCVRRRQTKKKEQKNQYENMSEEDKRKHRE